MSENRSRIRWFGKRHAGRAVNATLHNRPVLAWRSLMIHVLLAFLIVLSSSLHAQTPNAGPKPSNGTGSVSTAAGQIWEIDTSQSKLTFSLRHGVGRARGQFNVWSGTLSLPPDTWNSAAVDVTIQASSINTASEGRDRHLRNSDFFEVEKYPEIVFKSTSVQHDGDSITVAGNLTMKGVTKPVVLQGKFFGTTPGPKPRMNFQATTTIDRRDYGITYRPIVIGDEVTIEIVVAVIPK
jgi:polyisoprenoid-binding protein YceI